MEEIIQYVWQHKIFPIKPLKTTDGRTLEILNPGLQNHDSGPDFIGAKIKIDGIVWVGNVEVHVKSSDWYRHHHDTNPAYENVVLHVARDIDKAVTYPDGKAIPQMELPVPEYVLDNYNELLMVHSDPRCKHVIPLIPKIIVHNYQSALLIERLEDRKSQIDERLKRYRNDWESVCLVTIMRNFGFGINGDAFEKLAYSLPMQTLSKHRDKLFQIEALFFGQAGLLSDEALPVEYRAEAVKDSYYQDMRKEYAFLRHKFGLEPMDPHAWRFLRLRPQNFPHIRIAQLAMMYHQQGVNLSKIINAEDIKTLYKLFDTNVSQYWKTHYSFASTQSREVEKTISETGKNLLLINSVIPLMFAYGKYKSREDLCERALDFFEKIKPEDNRYIREWKSAGVECSNAGDSQALIQLTRSYCQPHDCLRCRFGHEFISRTPDFLKDE